MAVGILDQATAAQTAVTQRDTAGALDHIQQGKALASEILRTMASHSSPVLIEVRRDVETTSTYVDVKHRKNGEMSANRLKKNTTIGEVDRQVTASMLDVTSAAQRLDSAQDAVQRGDWPSAETALRAIPESVMKTKLDGNMPLLRAQENLELARARMLNDRAKDARGPLRAAAQALADFEQIAPGPHAEDAEYMRQQMLQIADKIDSDRDGALDHINVTWLPVLQKWQAEGGANKGQ